MRTIRGLNGYFKLKNARSMSTKNTSSKSSSAFNFFLAIGLLAGGGAYVYRRTRGAGKTEDNVSVDTSSHETDKNTLNLWKRLKSFFLSLHEPAFEKLLPERVLDPRHPRPYTLVIDLDKFLVCHVWDPDHGRWRIAKRPGADLFLFYAAQLYEVVVFSSLPQHEGDAIVKKLDPYGCISYSLYRFATRYKNGIYQKDISLLNRNLEKVIVIGVDTAGFASHPQNMIPVNPWDARLEKSSAESTDFSVLEEMVDFLEMLAFSKRDDIRPVVQKYRKMHEDGNGKSTFPRTFDRTQEAAFDLKQSEHQGSLQSRIGSVLGVSKGISKKVDSQIAGSYWGRKIERMKMRRIEYARIRDMMQAQLQAEMEKEKAYYAQHKMSVWDLFTKGPPPPQSETNSP